MNRAPLTRIGAERLRAELDHLKSVRRPQIIAAIAEARAHGDLRENAEYHAAREQQSFTEGRINELEAALATAEVIDTEKLNAGSRIVFGAKVQVVDVETDRESHYQIVGDLESDINSGLISISSPVARALIGKSEGDTVDIVTPSGKRSFEVLSVSYGAS
jgi:transcription elongation factor GreA